MISRLLAILLLAPIPAALAAGRPDSASIERLTGAKGSWNEEEGVFKVSVPRTDLAVTARGVRITPPLGLTSWAAFSGSGSQSMVMGDVVLSEEQVGPVMRVALGAGLGVTGLHNHFLGESPRVMFMHVGGAGEEATLAAAIGKVFAGIRARPVAVAPAGSTIDPASSSLDPARLDALLGRKGDFKDGVYKVVVGRTVRVHGMEAGAAMGVNTWAAFAGSPKRAVVDGDFATVASQLQPVLKALTGAGIDVVAIHNHMTDEEPRIVFLHYWGTGRAEDLARGLHAALAVISPTLSGGTGGRSDPVSSDARPAARGHGAPGDRAQIVPAAAARRSFPVHGRGPGTDLDAPRVGRPSGRLRGATG